MTWPGWEPGKGDSLSPPGFKEKDRRPYASSYMDRFPTRYFFRRDIRELVRLTYREFGSQKIHICTYEEHPPNVYGHGVWLGIPTERLSLDVWGPDGRGDPLPRELHEDVWNFLFYRRQAPDIWWAISRGDMWVRERSSNGTVLDNGVWVPSPSGAADSDPEHIWHPHITYLALREQRVLRPGYSI